VPPHVGGTSILAARRGGVRANVDFEFTVRLENGGGAGGAAGGQMRTKKIEIPVLQKAYDGR